MEMCELSVFINSLKKATKHIDQSLSKTQCWEKKENQWNASLANLKSKTIQSHSQECNISSVFIRPSVSQVSSHVTLNVLELRRSSN